MLIGLSLSATLAAVLHAAAATWQVMQLSSCHCCHAMQVAGCSSHRESYRVDNIHVHITISRQEQRTTPVPCNTDSDLATW
jgi:hypothetical protein